MGTMQGTRVSSRRKDGTFWVQRKYNRPFGKWVSFRKTLRCLGFPYLTRGDRAK
jgi:hypothetical protein